MTDRESRLLRLHELLADRATQGLSPPEAHELETLRIEFPNVDSGALDYCAAALDLALERDAEPLPDALREKVGRDALTWIVVPKGLDTAAPRRAAPPRRRLLNTIPWLAAAAGILLAILEWSLPREGDVVKRRAALLSQAPDVKHVPWQANTAGVTGDVVWSNQRQEGYLRLAGLAVNNPTDIQYQLWIFDGKRQGLKAVSGGVFDVSAAGEVIVPIDAGLKVFQPTLFAVTTEPPGGVVQHDDTIDPQKYRIVLTAPAES